MPRVSYQTVRLEKGRHTSPEHGACVMELASMIAGEPFTDHPESVSAPIACLLRAYNDTLDDRRRQDLFEYAARAVGTRASHEIEKLRAERLIAWADQTRPRRVWMVFGRLRRRATQAEIAYNPSIAARYAIRGTRRISDRMHRRVLELVDELIAIGATSSEFDVLPNELGSAPPVSVLKLGGAQ
jgi:hypothetical protein